MARPRKSSMDASILAAALEGLESQKKRLEEQIASVRAMIGGRPARAAAPEAAPAQTGSRRKRNLSPEARERIAAAQKRRWAAFRKSAKA